MTTSTETALVKHDPKTPIVHDDELAQREGDIRTNYAAFVGCALTGVEYCWKIGTDLRAVKQKQLYRPVAASFDEYVLGAFGFGAGWAKIAMRLAEIDRKLVMAKNLSLVEWHSIYNATTHLPSEKRPPVVAAAAQRVHEAREAEPKSPSNGHAVKAGPKPKPPGKPGHGAQRAEKRDVTARTIAQEELAKAGLPAKPAKEAKPASSRRPANPGEGEVCTETVSVSGKILKAGATKLENPKANGMAWMRPPKSPTGSQFRIVVGEQMLVFRIEADCVRWVVTDAPKVR